MIRYPLTFISIFNNTIKQKAYVILESSKYRKVIQIHQNCQARYYSKRPEFKSSFLSTFRKQADKKISIIDRIKKHRYHSVGLLRVQLILLFLGISLTGIMFFVVSILGKPERDEDGNPFRDEFSKDFIPVAYFKRALRDINYYRKLMREPSKEKLLPDPLPYPYNQPKYTLVLELTGVLVHSDWTYSTGWRFKKRPLLDYFLESLKQQYEIVIYTAEHGKTVFPLLDAIDPKNIIAFKLARDATHFIGGNNVKSLKHLNRDLSKVIYIDWNGNNLKYNKENLFCIKQWTGNDDDTWLLDIVSFLKAIADNNIDDVREVLKVYQQFDDPLEAFREMQIKMIDELEAQAAAQKKQEDDGVLKWAPYFLK